MLSSPDQTWVISGAMYWSVIETNIGILASSIPSFKVIASRYTPSLLGSSHQTSRSKQPGFHMMHMSGSRKDGDADSKAGAQGTQTHIRRGFMEESEEDLVAYASNISHNENCT